VGGWLILPVLGFAAVLVWSGVNLIASARNFENWIEVFTRPEEFASDLRWPITLSLALTVAIAVSALLCLYRVFVVGKGIRRIAIVHYVILLSSALVEVWAEYAMRLDFAEAVESIAPLAALKTASYVLLWGTYFLISERVSETFESGNRAFVSASGKVGSVDASR
jgi:hypothetical protein